MHLNWVTDARRWITSSWARTGSVFMISLPFSHLAKSNLMPALANMSCRSKSCFRLVSLILPQMEINCKILWWTCCWVWNALCAPNPIGPQFGSHRQTFQPQKYTITNETFMKTSEQKLRDWQLQMSMEAPPEWNTVFSVKLSKPSDWALYLCCDHSANHLQIFLNRCLGIWIIGSSWKRSSIINENNFSVNSLGNFSFFFLSLPGDPEGSPTQVLWAAFLWAKSMLKHKRKQDELYVFVYLTLPYPID